MTQLNQIPVQRKFTISDIEIGDYLQTFDLDDGDLVRVTRKSFAEVETVDGFGMTALYSPGEVSDIFLESEVENNF